MATRSPQVLLVSALVLGVAGCATKAPRRDASLEITPVATKASVSRRDDELYSGAVAAIHRRDYAAALDILQVARGHEPHDARILNAFGVVYDELGRFDLSARYYAQAQAADPGSRIVAENLAYSAVLQDKAASTALATATLEARQSATDVTQAPPAEAQAASAPMQALDAPQVADSAPVRRAAASQRQAAFETPSWRRVGDLAEAADAEAVASPPAQPFGQVLTVAQPDVRGQRTAAPVGQLAAAWPRVSPTQVLDGPAGRGARSASAAGGVADAAVAFGPSWLLAASDGPGPLVAQRAGLVEPVFHPMLIPADFVAAPEPSKFTAERSIAKPAKRATHEPASRTAAPNRAAVRPLHLLVTALNEIAHVLHLPIGRDQAPEVLLARSDEAPAPGRTAIRASVEVDASAIEPIARAPELSSPSLAAGAQAQPRPDALLLGSPVKVVLSRSTRAIGDEVKRELDRRGWTVAVSAESGRAPQESVIRFAKAHRRVAIGLANSLRIPVKLQPCRAECAGVMLILGEDAGSRQADARRRPRPLG